LNIVEDTLFDRLEDHVWPQPVVGAHLRGGVGQRRFGADQQRSPSAGEEQAKDRQEHK
jgi:hypothetical protein